MGAGAAAALLTKDDPAPYPSEDELRAGGFAVWPEDTVAEAMDACADAESWRLGSAETALRFANDVLRYPRPHVTHTIDRGPGTFRYFVNTRGPASDRLPMLIDVRKYDRCWFVVGATPREGGWPATLTYVHRSGQPHVAVKSTGERTEVGYGSLETSVDGTEQAVLDLSEVEPGATGHVISFSCRQVCDASAWTLGFVPEPATADVAKLTLDESKRGRGVCRSDRYNTRLGALTTLYASTVEEPIETSYGKPKVGKVVIRSEAQLRRLGIQPLGRDLWSFTVDGTDLVAHVVFLKDRCWKVLSIDDPDNDVLRSLKVGDDSLTLHLRWGEATSASVSFGSWRGGDSWEFERLDDPITVTGLISRPAEAPFHVFVSLHDGRRLVSHETSWYRTR